MTTNERPKIVKLKAENVKRLKAIAIEPDGSIVRITGKNGAGKSSILDSIEMVLGGRSAECSDPIRHGEDSASVVLETESLRVIKVWEKGKKSELRVESLDGARYSTPQKMLDDLTGTLSFDPMAFMRQKPGEQLTTLKAIAGVDFSDLDAERGRVYEGRADVNRELKKFEASLEQTAAWADGPDAEVSVSELVAKRDAANELANNLKQTDIDIAEAERRIVEANTVVVTETNRIGKLREAVEGVGMPDIEAITAQINSAESTNEAARNKVRYNQGKSKRDKLSKESKQHTERIAEIDKSKSKLIKSATMPIDGLAFADNGVLFNDIPLEQASQAEQIRISAAIGLALNPKLPVLLIRDGSLLDADSMAALAEFATEQDAQIWIEEVTDGEAVGIVIVDGELAEATELVGEVA